MTAGTIAPIPAALRKKGSTAIMVEPGGRVPHEEDEKRNREKHEIHKKITIRIVAIRKSGHQNQTAR